MKIIKKLKKVRKHSNKLLKLKLSLSKIYNKNHYLQNIKLKDIEYRLKKAFHVIYKYHFYNKKILFVGTPIYVTPKFQKVLRNTKHFLLPETIWVNGILTNKVSFFKHLFKNKKSQNLKISKFLFQLQKKFDLVVLLNEFNNKIVLDESYLTKIPIISLNSNLSIQENKPSYKIPGNFQFFNKKICDNFFYSILTAVFKKVKKIKKFINKIKSLVFKHRQQNYPKYRYTRYTRYNFNKYKQRNYNRYKSSQKNFNPSNSFNSTDFAFGLKLYEKEKQLKLEADILREKLVKFQKFFKIANLNLPETKKLYSKKKRKNKKLSRWKKFYKYVKSVNLKLFETKKLNKKKQVLVKIQKANGFQNNKV